MAETVDEIVRGIASRKPGAHFGVNAANVVAARDDPSYARDLAAADVVSADGQSVVWAARALGHSVPERVTGIDLMERLLSEAARRRWRVFLLGAKPDVVAMVAARARASNVDIVGARNGYFEEHEGGAVAAAIAALDPDIVFVGMPSPDKERFIMRHARAAGVRYCVAVGGSFDVLAGRKRRAPRVMQRAGLEWMVRLAQEPRRLAHRYTVTSARFLKLLFTELLRRRRLRRM